MSTSRVLARAQGNYLELIETLYSLPTNAEAWGQFGELLIKSMDARSGKIILRDNADPSVQTLWKTNFDEDFHQQYEEYYGARCPWSQGFVKDLPAGSFYSTFLEYPQQKWLESEVYRDWARYQDISHAVAVVLEQIASRQLIFTLQRSNSSGHFVQEEVDFLNRLVPHLERVMQLNRVLQDSAARADAVSEAASRNSLPFILLDDQRRVTYLSKAAEEALRLESVLTIRDGRLRLLNAAASSEVESPR